MGYNYQTEHLRFLEEKIKNIKIALFRSDINSELQLPKNIIQVLKIEQDGYIWFFTSSNNYQAQSIERSFYAYLDFYKKGTDCSLQVSGNAIVVDTDELLLDISNYSKEISSRLVLIKMKIVQAEYFEHRHTENISLVEKLRAAFNHLFLTHEHQVFDFS